MEFGPKIELNEIDLEDIFSSYDLLSLQDLVKEYNERRKELDSLLDQTRHSEDDAIRTYICMNSVEYLKGLIIEKNIEMFPDS